MNLSAKAPVIRAGVIIANIIWKTTNNKSGIPSPPTPIFPKAKNLKFIARAGSGLENIDVEFAKSENIECFNASEGNRQAVAEHSLGMILSLFNNLNIADREVRNRKWKREKNRGIELAGKTVGIIGFGNTGSAFANVIRGCGVKILAYDKYLTNYAFQSSMEEIYKQADIVSLHIPLTDETRYLVNLDNEPISNSINNRSVYVRLPYRY